MASLTKCVPGIRGSVQKNKYYYVLLHLGSGVSVLKRLGNANRVVGSFVMDFIFEFANFRAIGKI